MQVAYQRLDVDCLACINSIAIYNIFCSQAICNLDFVIYSNAPLNSVVKYIKVYVNNKFEDHLSSNDLEKQIEVNAELIGSSQKHVIYQENCFVMPLLASPFWPWKYISNKNITIHVAYKKEICPAHIWAFTKPVVVESFDGGFYNQHLRVFLRKRRSKIKFKLLHKLFALYVLSEGVNIYLLDGCGTYRFVDNSCVKVYCPHLMAYDVALHVSTELVDREIEIVALLKRYG